MSEHEAPEAGSLAHIPGHDVLFLLQSFVSESTRYGEMVRRGHQLSRTDVHAIGIIKEAGHKGYETTVTGLAEQLVLTVPATTATVDRLEAHGYVVRQPSPSDGRRVILEPTAEAGAVGREMFRPMSLELLHVLEALDPAEREFLRRVLPELTEAVQRAMPE